MKLRLASPEYVIDIDPLADVLGYIQPRGDEVRIGAMTRHNALLESAFLERELAIFTDAERVIADPVVRNRGTIGGALCQADPSEDLSAVCAAVKARMVIRGTASERVVDMHEFHQGPYETAVGPAEMLVEIRVPLTAAHRQRLPEGRPARGGLGGGRRRRVDRARRRRPDRGRRAWRSRPWAGTSRCPKRRPRWSASRPRTRCSSARPGSPGPRANRPPTNVDPRTTSGTSPASSPNASSGAPANAHY